MTTKENIEQLKSLIEHFNNGGNDFNATDIEAIKFLLKENQELKKQLKPDYYTKGLEGTLKEYQEIMTKFYTQQKEFIKWLEDGIEKVKNTEFLDERIQRAGLIAYNRCLRKYKSIIGADK